MRYVDCSLTNITFHTYRGNVIVKFLFSPRRSYRDDHDVYVLKNV